MSNIYTFPKATTEKIPRKIAVIFRNGDYFELAKKEIVRVSLDYYDNLARLENSAVRVCHGGDVVLKIEKGSKRRRCFLHDEESYQSDGAEYLRRRLCEGGIERILIFNENNWHHTVLGDAVAKRDDDGLVTVSYRHNSIYGDFSGDEFKIALGDVQKATVEKIRLDFENCDVIDVFGEEILDMKLTFDKRLHWNSNGYGRRVVSGYILIRFDKEITYRRASLYPNWTSKKGIRPLLKRLCYDGTYSNIDVCNLYVDYNYIGYGVELKEVIALSDAREKGDGTYDFEVSGDDFRDYDYDGEEYDDDDDDDDEFISGYARLNRDKTVLLVFGKGIED